MVARLQAVPVTRPRAVAYIRVSHERDEMISPELQETAIRDHCARNGYDIVDVLSDLDLSGQFWKRRKVEQAIAMIEARTAEVVVVWKISRVARNRLDWNIAVDRIETVGGRLESATEPIDTTNSSGRFARGILAELAAFESERAGEQWQETHRRRWRNGLPHSGRPRFGYTYDKSTFYSIDPETGPIVAEMYARYIAGETYVSIRRWLEPMKLGTMSTHKSISDFLDSGFPAGVIRHHDPECALGHRPGATCKNTVRDDGAHERIVTREVYDEYMRLRAERAFIPARLKMPFTSFAGLITCTHCGWRYVHHLNKGRLGQYRCGNSQDCPSPHTVSSARLDGLILDWLPEYAGAVNAHAASTATGRAAAGVERDRLNRIAIDADKALIQLSIDRARRIIPEATYIAARDELTAERDAAQRRSGEMVKTRAESAQRRKVALDLFEAWPLMTGTERNNVLRDLARIHISAPDPGTRAVTVKIWPVWDTPTIPKRPRPR
ncbi:recombinase family protein [Cryobacterium sp. RTC2.1]|uniref:recombinase family protein n=1 Tax=Cryobacterium sp. RTC2.1 TaxID=3048634 RepID=UPI002B22730D|nr:recombinase family protein [Cryobacterium sp. RTC2.1]MEB0001639.1 recombinase family protein [Cryobacterium sp. RTC2.1]